MNLTQIDNSSIRYPVYVGEPPHNLDFYFSLRQLQYGFEAWITEEKNFVGYDCEGRLLKFSQTKEKIPSIMVEIAENEPSHLNVFKKSLIDDLCAYYRHHPLVEEHYKQATLIELINDTIKIDNFVSQHYWPSEIIADNFSFPLVIQEDEKPAQIFNTLSLAESSLSVDKKHIGYDSEGRCLKFLIRKKGILWGKKKLIRIFLDEAFPTHQKELSELLVANSGHVVSIL